MIKLNRLSKDLLLRKTKFECLFYGPKLWRMEKGLRS